MAPEMVVELRADNRSDLFSLGARLLRDAHRRAALLAERPRREVLEQVIAARTPRRAPSTPASPSG
jgi:hypothetical protein